MPDNFLRRVLSEYGEPFASAPFTHYPSSGLSGARLWRCDIGGGRYVLRRWPDGQMNTRRLTWIHERLGIARHAGLTFVPDLVSPRGGGSFLEYDGTAWQLETWVAGEPDLCDPPQLGKVTAALEALARFHQAVKLGYSDDPSAFDRSPALVDRAELLDEMLRCGLELIRSSAALVAPREPWAQIAVTALPWLTQVPDRATRIRAEVAKALEVKRALQPVIRDVTRDHVLFTGETVTGLVDYGAMAVDHVTVDLARLVGSYERSHLPRTYFNYDALVAFAFGQYAYRDSKHAPRLTDEDRRLIVLLDQSGVLVAAYRWLRWVFVEERSFSDPQAVARRIGKLITRDMAFWAESANR